MKKLIASVAFIALLFSALAHEYILLPYQFRLAKGGMLELHLFVADGFNIQLERPVQKSKTKTFSIITEHGKTDLLMAATDGALPVMNATVDFEGLGLIHMERTYARNTLPNQQFLDYLKEDNIENISLQPDTTKKEQSERYTRYLKCLVQSGSVKEDTLYKTVLDQNFEIVLLQNPYKLQQGDSVAARILFKGKPLANKLITARNRLGNRAALAQYARTNSMGICSFAIDRPGDWFIHVTHMIASPDKRDADWESFWASYSFGINFP